MGGSDKPLFKACSHAYSAGELIMDNGDGSMETGATTPLLIKGFSSENLEEETTPGVQKKSHLRHKSTNWLAPTIILGFECLESTAFFSISTNLVVYLRSMFHESNVLSATNASAWTGTCYFVPLLGAVIADTYWGNYKIVFLSTLIYLLGLVFVTLTARIPALRPPPCEGSLCQQASVAQILALFCGLYLVAIGSGGVKSGLLPLGVEQFNDENSEGREKKGSFFNLFYVCITVGLLTSGVLIVWIQENVGWALGFGIATLCMALALGSFISATPAFCVRKPSGSPLRSILQVSVSSFRKMNLELPLDSSLLYENNDKDLKTAERIRLEHTDEFRFLDKAAIIWDSDLEDGSPLSSWNLCTVTQIEEVKILLRLLPIWATGILFSAALSQMYTTFIQQGSAMNTKIGSFSIPPASLTSVEVIFVIAWVLLCNKLIVSLKLSQLQRMGTGRFLIIVTMAIAALLEMHRLESSKTNKTMSIAWQLPQYFFLAGSEVFSCISQLEFFYGQAPETMKSMCTAFALLNIALGNYFSSLIIAIVAAVTTRGGNPGWIPDDLSKGHLDYFFWSMAGLCALNFVVYFGFARNYRLKKVIL